jgi:hypothetical protein
MISRKVKAVLAIASFFGASFAAQAGSLGHGFTVNATLTPSCTVSGATSTSFSYTGQSNPAIVDQAAGTVTYTCTRGLAPTVIWDATNGSTSASASHTAGATATGTAAGIVYTLATGAATVAAGTAATTTTGATAATYAFALKLNVAGGQPGDVGATTSSARTLTLSY